MFVTFFLIYIRVVLKKIIYNLIVWREVMNNQSKYFHHVEHRKFQSSSKATLWSSLIITLIFTIVEFVGGLYANSLALLSDSFHMLSDVLALGLSMLAIYFASKPPTKHYTYGFLRLEIIVAFLNGLALIVISLGIMYEGILRIIHPGIGSKWYHDICSCIRSYYKYHFNTYFI